MIDDDAAQLELRAMLLESKGHLVQQAECPASALQKAIEFDPQVILMDLLLPTLEAGKTLLKELRRTVPQAKIVVLSGWSGDVSLDADAVLRKPVRTVQMLETLARLAVCLLVAMVGLDAADNRFRTQVEAEVGAEVTARGPEGRVIEIQVDKRPALHVVLYAGEQERKYPVSLGRLPAGEHVIRIRGAEGIAASIGNFREIAIGDPAFSHMANAPVLFARTNTIGKFSDVPLMMYVTRGGPPSEPWLEYTVVFSNEDGGTSTRNLMARWGRATDIEYIYRVWIGPDGRPLRAIIQGKDHKDVAYEGPREAWHPLLIPVTDNNMVSHGQSSVRYQLPPLLIDLTNHSREQVMDEDPIMYAVAARELAREGKLRSYGTQDGEKISDPRNYLVIEAKLSLENAGIQALARAEGSDTWHAGSIGLGDNFITRSGWIRTAIELKPGANATHIAFECIIPKKQGSCKVEAIGKVFGLKDDYSPGRNRFQTSNPIVIMPGRIQAISLN